VWTVLKNFLTVNALKFWAALAALLTFLGMVWKIRQSGRDAEKLDSLKRLNKERKQADEIRDTVRMRPDGDAADELRKRFSRD
jgi:uncharacterized membrane protein YqjE